MATRARWPQGAQHEGDHTHALGAHAFIRPDQKQLPVGQGQSAQPGHLGGARRRDGGVRGGRGGGRAGCHLPGPEAPRGARTRAPVAARAAGAQAGASGDRWRGRGAAAWPLGPGDRGGTSGPWDLRNSPAPRLTPPFPRTSAARMRRNCSGEGKAGRPTRCHSPWGLQTRLSKYSVTYTSPAEPDTGPPHPGPAPPDTPAAGEPRPPALGPRLTAARGHPVQAQGQGDTAVGVGAGVVAGVDQHRGAPGVGRASRLVGAGQDAHGVVAVQHHSVPRHLGPELLSVCRVCVVVTTEVATPLPSQGLAFHLLSSTGGVRPGGPAAHRPTGHLHPALPSPPPTRLK